METDKVITYSAIGVAGIVFLVFLLDLTAGIFYRNIAMDIMFMLGRRSCSGRESRRCLSSAKAGDARRPTVVITALLAIDETFARPTAAT